ncbi:MAG: ABC transporter permease [Phaeodactylibacter sp.]|nr:ABC transporter permease [Phaeodactylibacter sp.]
MWQNYLKTALRNLSRNKLYSGINILGLALGMAIAILILLYVNNELSYDKWVPGQENVYRVYRSWEGNKGGVVWTPSLLASKLMDEFPEVESAAGLSPYGTTMLEYKKNKRYVEEVAAVDSTFFQAVHLPFLYGNPLEALQRPQTVVLSKGLAEQIFGPVDPVGQLINLNDEGDYEVAGVLDEYPGNSHLFYQAYIPFTWFSDSWTGNNRSTYVKTHPATDITALEGKMTALLTDLKKQEYKAHNYQYSEDEFEDWKMQPMQTIHLDSKGFDWGGDTGGNIRYVYIFSLIALLLLLVAAINYVNLSTALAAQRSKEVAVRKTTGANRPQLVVQFLSETVIQSLIAAMVAVGLAEGLLPLFNTVTGRELSFLNGEPLWLILPLAGLSLLVGLLAGAFPALHLSSFEPASALKNQLGEKPGKQTFRKILVVTQFSISIALIVVMAFVFRQVHFMMESELGFQPDQVLVAPFNLDDSFKKFENLRSEFLSIPGVKSVAASSRLPGQKLPDWGMLMEGRAESVNPYVIFTGEGFDKTLGLEMAQGRFLSSEFTQDTVNNFVVNEAFVKQFNIPEPVLGAKVKFSFDEAYGQIVGVIRDFHFRGLQSSIRPLAISGRPSRWYAAFKVSTQDLPATVRAIEKQWAQVEPAHPMRQSFLDEDFAKQYDEQQRFGKSMLYATILTIFIAMLGLFGLATHTAQLRTKEIGIRKVLGASVTHLVSLLSRDFLKLVAIAFCVATPVAWLLSRRWLEDFAYRIEVEWWVFALAGATALLIAFLAVSYQSVRAALANPVEALRSE